MNSFKIFLFEWKHFIKSPFKLLAFVFFIAAAIYGLYNGANLYHNQHSEIARIAENQEQEKLKYLAYYDEGKVGPENRPWINVTTPFWAMWYNQVHHFKSPSAAMVYSTGQAEQYGFYKRVTFRASPYDSDLTQEIANPERLQTGTLDFTFAVLYLLPLLLLIVLYNLKSAETEQGFFRLIEVQVGSSIKWLLARMAFYISLVLLTVIVLLLYGAVLTPILTNELSAFWEFLFFSALYIGFWSTIFFFILRNGQSILNNTLKMLSVWLVFCFIIPAAVHLSISIVRPVNLMTDFIDAKRDQREELFDLPLEELHAKLNLLYPELVDSKLASDSENNALAINRSGAALENQLTKESIVPIEIDNQSKNELITASYWVNPVVMFQNRLNSISKTHYNDYKQYRNEIQQLVDKQLRIMVIDIWNEEVIDRAKYLEYSSISTN